MTERGKTVSSTTTPIPFENASQVPINLKTFGNQCTHQCGITYRTKLESVHFKREYYTVIIIFQYSKNHCIIKFLNFPCQLTYQTRSSLQELQAPRNQWFFSLIQNPLLSSYCFYQEAFLFEKKREHRLIFSVYHSYFLKCRVKTKFWLLSKYAFLEEIVKCMFTYSNLRDFNLF